MIKSNEVMPSFENKKELIMSLNNLKSQEGNLENEKGRAINVVLIHDEIKENEKDAANNLADQLEGLGDVKFFFGSNNIEKSKNVAEYLKERIIDSGIRNDSEKKELDGARSVMFDQEYLQAMREIASESGTGAMVDFWIDNPNKNSPQAEAHATNYQKIIDKLAEISRRMSSAWPEISVVCIVDPSIGAWLSKQTGQKNAELGSVVRVDNPVVIRFKGDNSPKNFIFNGKEYPLHINERHNLKK